MKIKRNLSILTPLLGALFLTSCGTDPYAPPPTKANVTSVEVDLKSFGSRPDAYAIVSGTLSNSSAQLVDAKQYRKGYTLYIDVMEQTPRNTTGAMSDAPFRQRIPIETLGLNPGSYILNVNGVEERLELPAAGASPDQRGEFL